MALKETQNYKLAQILGTGEVVLKSTIMESLGISDQSVAVYIFDLRKKFGADIENVKDNGKITGYKLLNKINVPKYRINNSQVEPSAKKVVTADKTEPAANGAVPIIEETDNTKEQAYMDDLKNQLGLNDFGDKFNLDNG